MELSFTEKGGGFGAVLVEKYVILEPKITKKYVFEKQVFGATYSPIKAENDNIPPLSCGGQIPVIHKNTKRFANYM